MITGMASHRTRTLLVTLALLACTTGAAAQVQFNGNTIARLGNADINLTALTDQTERVTITPANVTLDDLTFGVSSDNTIDIDIDVFSRQALDDSIVTRFVADATAGTTATFTLRNLVAGEQYNVSRDSVPFLLQESSDGTLTFTANTWSPHTFTVQLVRTGGLEASQGTITTLMGESITASLILTNPQEDADTYTVQVDTQMDNGNAVVTLDTGEEEGGTVTVDVSPESSRAMTINVEGSSCLGTTCTGDATFTAISQSTSTRYTETVNLIIRRSARIHGSPGITWPYLLLIAVLGGITTLLRS